MKSALNAAVLVLLGFSASMQPARAQEVDAYFGLGEARDRSNGQQIETFGDKTLHATPRLGGVSTDFGLNFFFNKQVGIGWTGSWKWTSSDYAGLTYQSSFIHSMASSSRLNSVRSVSRRNSALESE
jgi:opacity protein-like surface antigen